MLEMEKAKALQAMRMKHQEEENRVLKPLRLKAARLLAKLELKQNVAFEVVLHRFESAIEQRLATLNQLALPRGEVNICANYDECLTVLRSDQIVKCAGGCERMLCPQCRTSKRNSCHSKNCPNLTVACHQCFEKMAEAGKLNWAKEYFKREKHREWDYDDIYEYDTYHCKHCNKEQNFAEY